MKDIRFDRGLLRPVPELCEVHGQSFSRAYRWIEEEKVLGTLTLSLEIVIPHAHIHAKVRGMVPPEVVGAVVRAASIALGNPPVLKEWVTPYDPTPETN